MSRVIKQIMPADGWKIAIHHKGIDPTTFTVPLIGWAVVTRDVPLMNEDHEGDEISNGPADSVEGLFDSLYLNPLSPPEIIAAGDMAEEVLWSYVAPSRPEIAHGPFKI